jgi:hypothetical protein
MPLVSSTRSAARRNGASLLVAPQQRLLVGVEEEHAVGHAERAEVRQHRAQRLEELAAADVGDDGRTAHLGATVDEEVDEPADHLRRQVVDAEVAVVLEDVHRGRLAGPGEAGDDDEVLEARGPVRVLRRDGHVGHLAGRRGHRISHSCG